MTQPILEISKAVPSVDQTFSWHECSVESALSAETYRSMTWSELVSRLSEHDVGPKHGPSFIPYTFAFPCRRKVEFQTGADAYLAIDIDGLYEADVARVRAYLRQHLVDHCTYTTWSLGDPKKQGKHPVRLVARLDRPQTSAREVQIVRAGFGTLIAEALGLNANDVSDRKTWDKGNQPMFFPREAPERQGTAQVFDYEGGQCLSCDALVAYGAGPFAAWEAAKIRRDNEEELIASLPDEVKGHPAQTEAAKQWVVNLCRGVEGKEEGLRPLTGQAPYYAGRMVKAKILDLKWAEEMICNAVTKRKENGFADNTSSVRGRHAQVRKAIRDGLAAGPWYPLAGFVHEGRVFVQTFAQAELEKAMRALVPAQMVTADRAVAGLAELFRTRPSRPTVVKISTGAGKSQAMTETTKEWARSGRPALVFQPGHELLRDTKKFYKDFPITYIRSSSQPTEKTGEAQCLRRNEKAVLAVIQNRGNLTASVCRTCTLKPDCAAFQASRQERQLITIAPGVMAKSIVETALEQDFMHSDLLVFFDEEPAGPQEVLFSKDELIELSSKTDWVDLLEASMGSKLLDLVNDAWSGRDTSSRDFSLKQLMFRNPSERIDDRTGRWAVLADLLSVVPFWHTKRWVENDTVLVFTVSSPEWEVIEETNAFILTATPNEKLYEGKSYNRVEFDCSDTHTTLRAMVYTRQTSRSVLCPNGNIQVDQLKERLKDVLDVVGDAPVLLVTYKVISDALNDNLRHLLEGRNIEVSYFEVMLGVNNHRGKRKLVTLGDPRTPPPIGTKDFSQSQEIAANKTAQAHGRTRDCRRTPEEGAADHFHFGTVLPKGWHHLNCFVYHAESFGDKTDRLSPQVVAAIRTMCDELGKAATAQKVGVPVRTLREWLANRSQVGPTHLENVCAVLGIDTRMPGNALSDLKQKLREERAN